MFGRYYRQWEAAAITDPKERCRYARWLAADILNRALMVHDAFGRVYDEGGWRKASAEAGHALMNVLEGFVLDCEEARIRGRRMRFFAATEDGERVDPDGVELDEVLSTIGGPLAGKDSQDLDS